MAENVPATPALVLAIRHDARAALLTILIKHADVPALLAFADYMEGRIGRATSADWRQWPVEGRA
jgi:hypothetical protein